MKRLQINGTKMIDCDSLVKFEQIHLPLTKNFFIFIARKNKVDGIAREIMRLIR
jgi:hypothetical protein